MAYEFGTANTGVIKANIAINENGTIAQEGETAVASKSYSLPGVKAGATFAEANTVYNAIVGGISKGTYNQASMTKTITVGVVETA